MNGSQSCMNRFARPSTSAPTSIATAYRSGNASTPCSIITTMSTTM